MNPDEETKKLFTGRQSQFMEEKKELEKYIGRPSVTKDGVRVEIVANIGKPEDVEKVLQYDGEGIGLFRTEFLFMDREAMPTEDEQFEAYKKVAEAMDGKPVIIRTLDIGGDKEIPYMGLEKDENLSLAIGPSVSAWTGKRIFISPSCGHCCGPALTAISASWFLL